MSTAGAVKTPSADPVLAGPVVAGRHGHYIFVDDPVRLAVAEPQPSEGLIRQKLAFWQAALQARGGRKKIIAARGGVG